MELKLSRLGRTAILASLTDEAEELAMKQLVQQSPFRLAITFVSGLSNEIRATFVKSVINCAVQNGIIQKSPGQIHAVVHAALDAYTGVVHAVPADASLKIKVAIVTDGMWVAVAVYGDSAFYHMTNHERSGLGVMHLRG